MSINYKKIKGEYMYKEKTKKKKCWQCKKYTVSIYKNEFGGYSETCSNKCGPALLGKKLNLMFKGV